MAGFTTLAFVTLPLCSGTLLPADVLASGVRAIVTPQLACVLLGDTADDGDPVSPVYLRHCCNDPLAYIRATGRKQDHY